MRYTSSLICLPHQDGGISPSAFFDGTTSKLAGLFSALPLLLSVKQGSCEQGWKLKPKPKPENLVLKEILETQTETDTYIAKILKT